MKTEFKINFISNYKDCQSISFLDESIYAIDPTYPALKVTIPDINKYVEIAYSPKTYNIIRNTTLGLVKLPDGLWTFEFSVKPNNKVNQVFTDYRICDALNLIRDSLCSDPSEMNIKAQMANWRALHAAKEIAQQNPIQANVIYQTTLSKIKTC